MSAAAAAAAAAVVVGSRESLSNSSRSVNETSTMNDYHQQPYLAPVTPQLSRYESQKRRDWITFGQYLKNHRPPLNLSRCSGAHVLEFLRYLDQFGKTKVHGSACPFYGHPNPPAPCPCPLKQAWGSLDALIGRLRAAFEENGGLPETNPFGARAVRLYLREVRDTQAKARGIAYEKKKRKKPQEGTQLMMMQQREEQGQRGHFVSGYSGGAGAEAAVFGVGVGGGAAQPNGVMIGGGSSAAARGSMMPLSVLNC